MANNDIIDPFEGIVDPFEKKRQLPGQPGSKERIAATQPKSFPQRADEFFGTSEQVPDWAKDNPELYGALGVASIPGRMIKNLPSDVVKSAQELYGLGKGVAGAVVHPIETYQKAREMVPQIAGGLRQQAQTAVQNPRGAMEEFSDFAVNRPISAGMAVSGVGGLARAAGRGLLGLTADEIAKMTPVEISALARQSKMGAAGVALEGLGRGAELPVTAAAEAAGKGIEAGKEAIKNVVYPQFNEKKFFSDVKKGMQAITPSVAKAGGSAGRSERYYQHAADGVEAIIERSPNLKITDEFGEIIPDVKGAISSGKINLPQYSQAIEQTKNSLLSEYSSMLEGKTNIDTNNVMIKALEDIAKDPVKLKHNPKLAEAAQAEITRLKSLPKELVSESPVQVQNAITQYNEELKGFYGAQDVDTTTRKVLTAAKASALRESLESTIGALEGPEYSRLKRMYGSLSNIEKDVAKAVVIDARKKPSGLLDLPNVASGAALVEGVMAHNAPVAAAGLTAKALSMYQKMKNNPNRRIGEMFKNTNKQLERRAAKEAMDVGLAEGMDVEQAFEPGLAAKMDEPQKLLTAGKGIGLPEARGGYDIPVRGRSDIGMPGAVEIGTGRPPEPSRMKQLPPARKEFEISPSGSVVQGQLERPYIAPKASTEGIVPSTLGRQPTQPSQFPMPKQKLQTAALSSEAAMRNQMAIEMFNKPFNELTAKQAEKVLTATFKMKFR